MTFLEHLNSLIQERWHGPTMADYDREKARMAARELRAEALRRKRKLFRRKYRAALPEEKLEPWNNMRVKLTLHVCPSVAKLLK